MLISAGIEHKNKQKAVKLINQQIEDMKNGLITDVEFENAKKYYIHALTTVYDSLDVLSNFYYMQSISASPKSIEELIDITSNIKKENVQKVAQKCEWELEYFLTK